MEDKTAPHLVVGLLLFGSVLSFADEGHPGWEPVPLADGENAAASWHPLGGGCNDYVISVAVSESNVYVGGEMTLAGGGSASYIARWDGSAWHSVGTGVNNQVREVVANGTDVYVGGYFTQAGGVPANQIARWDGGAWSALGSGVNNAVQSIAVSGADVYVAGFSSHRPGAAPRTTSPAGERLSARSLPWATSFPAAACLSSSRPTR